MMENQLPPGMQEKLERRHRRRLIRHFKRETKAREYRIAEHKKVRASSDATIASLKPPGHEIITADGNNGERTWDDTSSK